MHWVRPHIDDFARRSRRLLTGYDVNRHRGRNQHHCNYGGDDDVARTFGVGLSRSLSRFLLKQTHSALILAPTVVNIPPEFQSLPGSGTELPSPQPLEEVVRWERIQYIRCGQPGTPQLPDAIPPLSHHFG